MAARSAVRPATRRSTLQLATAVSVTLLTVSWWPVADAKFQLTKCCQKGEMYVEKYKCTPYNKNDSSHEFRVPKYVNQSGAFDFYRADEYELSYGFQVDNRSEKLFPKANNKKYFYVLDTGALQTNSATMSPKNYSFCFEEKFKEGNFFYTAVGDPEISPCDLGDERSRCGCTPGYYNSHCFRPPAFYYIYVMAISLPFLFLTFMVYALIKELRSLHTMCIMCYSGNVFLANAIFIIIQCFTKDEKENVLPCNEIGFLQLFLFLAEFSWSNVICYDMWRDVYTQRTNKRSEKKEIIKLIKYSIYAWGYSILITLISFIGEHQYLPFLPNPNIRKHTQCLIDSNQARWTYLYGPATALLIVNSLMCIHIMKTSFKHSARCKKTLGNKGCLNRTYKKFIFCVKLSIIMGMNLIIDMIIVTLYSERLIGVYVEVIGLSIGNAAQGVSIFVICVCNKSNLRSINKMFRSRIRRFTNESTENSTKMTSCVTHSTTRNELKVNEYCN